MNITVVGAGYVSMANAAALAIQAGHRVTVLDIDADRVARINRGESTVADPELEAEFAKAKPRNLTATTDLKVAFDAPDVVIVATPTNYDPKANFFNMNRPRFFAASIRVPVLG